MSYITRRKRNSSNIEYVVSDPGFPRGSSNARYIADLRMNEVKMYVFNIGTPVGVFYRNYLIYTYALSVYTTTTELDF